LDNLFQNLIFGFSMVLNIQVIIFMTIGVIVGIIVGAIPGLTTTMAIGIMIPLTFPLAAHEGLALLTATFVGGISGGLISAILLNMPGTPSSIATTFDGYPMTKKGLAGKALGFAIVSSFIGGTIGLIALVLLAPILSRIAVKVGPAEYFSLVIFAMTMIVSLSAQSLLKGLSAAVIGFFLSTIGTDPIVGTARFTLGFYQLQGGLALLPVGIGLYAVSQVIIDIEQMEKEKIQKVKVVIKDFFPTLSELKENIFTLVSSSLIGLGVGMLPGMGGGTANFLAYDQAKRRSKHPEEFGTGIVEGIIAPEASNNATIGGSFIPMITLGIPGDAVTALLLGGLMIHGLQPGPLLMTKNPEVVYSIFAAYFIANLMTISFQFWGIKAFIRVLSIPKHILHPIILTLCIMGSYAMNNRIFDVWVLIIFGVFGYFIRIVGIPRVPIILGFILGRIAETNLRKAILVQDDLISLITRPFSALFLILAVISLGTLFYQQYSTYFQNKKIKK